ncbi:MAG: GspH/FimT family pseudopilin [Betaproteobacteria bacterium]|nr:GspH/FimT family pseudopilin [Betaproteobacteria bacterium]
MSGSEKFQFPSGVTLIELLVALSVLSILLAVGVPSFSQFSTSSRLNSYSNTLFSHLTLARSEAIKRNSRVVVCKSSDGLSCAGSGDWNQGWVVFVDLDSDANISGGEQILTTMSSLPAGYSFSGNANVSNYVSYDGQGITKLTTGAFQSGTITLCPAPPAEGGNGRYIIISSSGRLRIAKITSCA